MSTEADASFSNLRRPLLIQRVVLTILVCALVVALPLGRERFTLAATILAVQFVSTWLIERERREPLDQLGAYLLVEHHARDLPGGSAADLNDRQRLVNGLATESRSTISVSPCNGRPTTATSSL